MLLKDWDELPNEMKNNEVRNYYDSLKRKRISLFLKRVFDITIAIIAFITFSPLFIIISIAIKIDSKGPVMFRQVRVTQYGKRFKIFKFRTMVNEADKIGAQVTTQDDARVTKVGRVLRRLRLDEIPQLFNIILGDMSFVGTRPEVVKYVEMYTDEMKATLLLPAGVTSEASIQYKDESRLLTKNGNPDVTYIELILPGKMGYNLQAIKDYSFWGDIRTMLRTIFIMFGIDIKSKV